VTVDIRKPEFGRYLIVFGLLLAIGLLLVAAFTLVIDPFGISPIHIEMSGVNTSKIERNERDRLIKPYEMLATWPQTIIVGTSRVKQGFDPDAAPVALGRVYNAGIDALEMHEARTFIKQLLHSASPVKHIFLEVFPYQFGIIAGWPIKREPLSGADRIGDFASVTLSISAVMSSLRTIAASMNGPRSDATRRNGYRPIGGPHPGPGFMHPSFPSLVTIPALPLDFDAFRELDETIALCRHHGIPLTVFVMPIHPLSGLLLWGINAPAMANWLTELGARPNVVSFLTTPEFRDGKLEAPKRYHADSSHPSYLAGELMMRDFIAVKAGTPMRYGRLLNPISVQTERQDWLLDLAEWANLNRDSTAPFTADHKPLN
jgi:hypothetical protein